ncbi:MAG TPA: carbohydrate-binding family 9-like protein [Chthonomonadaceae bacterium]|nr:carbohydrate-binding family 9-like protein [Chthonomonadaceae bacterium]
MIPRGYLCYRASGPITIDGRLDDPAWHNAPWTEDFVDIEGDSKPRPRFRTRVKMLWDDDYLYVGADIEEPHVWATLTQHDSVIFQDNDFEVFLDPDGDSHLYYEIEINALNTEWDLLLIKPYRDGGPAVNGWEIPGLKTAVHVDGTLNDPSDTDKGWSVELAFPWKALKECANMPCPPHDGDQWQINFSRVEWEVQVIDGHYQKIPQRPEDNWVWSPQGAINMHMPEKWGYIQFTTAPTGQAVFHPDPSIPARDLLHRIYYAEHSYYKQHGHWAPALSDLDLAHLPHDDRLGPPRLETTEAGFLASVTLNLPDGTRQRWHISDDSRIWHK